MLLMTLQYCKALLNVKFSPAEGNGRNLVTYCRAKQWRHHLNFLTVWQASPTCRVPSCGQTWRRPRRRWWGRGWRSPGPPCAAHGYSSPSALRNNSQVYPVPAWCAIVPLSYSYFHRPQSLLIKKGQKITLNHKQILWKMRQTVRVKNCFKTLITPVVVPKWCTIF